MFIELKDASKVYGEGESAVKALDRAEMSAEQGEVIVVLGPSGSGKSTMLNIIGGLDTLDSGSLTVGGRTVSGLKQKALTECRREDLGFIFQFYNLIPDLTARENVEVVADIASRPMNMDEIFDTLDINGLQDRFPRELSGGQQQRVAIARAMVKNPKLLLCDELTGALDTKSSLGVLQAVQALNDRYHTTVVIITHNAAISGMADRIIRIKDGKIQSNEVNVNKVSPMDLVL
ncbi:MAG: ABC transporter ATP-binding protein [Evtepia sp.]|uniref:ABC transporter ATP-binding protein n=1 Tax=Evtepia sp. TaxID=2773933 RepID=UPI002A749CA8|nr:ABC transporter ATP-binding protein [Evtepia sp.]MDY3014807.1 ABC transporter ATP-binding protein [Evtepia sp.]